MHGPTKSVATAAFFDEGSQSTMIDESLANVLGIDGKISPITYQWTKKIVQNHPNSKEITLSVSGHQIGSKVHQLRRIYTIDMMNTCGELSFSIRKMNFN